MAEKKSNTNKRRWMKPQQRATGYAAERKSGVRMFGKRAGEELNDYDKGIRSGYLLAQSDSAGLYKYKQALNEGKSKEQAKRISQQRGKKQ